MSLRRSRRPVQPLWVRAHHPRRLRGALFSSEEQSVLALKDVAQTLETQGVLGAIRAQLRAAVYTAIDTQEREQGIHLENIKVRTECPA